MPLSSVARTVMAESDNSLGMAIAAEEPWVEADFLFCCLADEAGVEGLTESSLWLSESGVSQSEMAMANGDDLARYVLGTRPTDVQAIGVRLDRNVVRNEMAKGLLDIVCHELAARQVGRPVHDLIGGAAVDRMPLCALLPLGPPDFVAHTCAGYQRAGFHVRCRRVPRDGR